MLILLYYLIVSHQILEVNTKFGNSHSPSLLSVSADLSPRIAKQLSHSLSQGWLFSSVRQIGIYLFLSIRWKIYDINPALSTFNTYCQKTTKIQTKNFIEQLIKFRFVYKSEVNGLEESSDSLPSPAICPDPQKLTSYSNSLSNISKKDCL